MDKREHTQYALGSCCCCERTDVPVQNIVMLHKKSPIPGHGWGCVVCYLPPDGASYVCCDECLREQRPPRFACQGYPDTEGRVPFDELTGDYRHIYTLHLDDLRWLKRSYDAGDPKCVCSLCGDPIPEDAIPLRLWRGEGRQMEEAVICDACFTAAGGVVFPPMTEDDEE